MLTLRQITTCSAKEISIPTHAVMKFLDDESICSLPVKFILCTSNMPEVGKSYQVKWTDKKLYDGEVIAIGNFGHLECFNVVAVFNLLIIIYRKQKRNDPERETISR